MHFLFLFFLSTTVFSIDCETPMTNTKYRVPSVENWVASGANSNYNPLGIPHSFFNTDLVPIPKSIGKDLSTLIQAKKVIHEEYGPIRVIGKKVISTMGQQVEFIEALDENNSTIMFDPRRNQTMFNATDIDYAQAITILKHVDFRLYTHHLIGEALRLIAKKEMNNNQLFSTHYLAPIFKRTLQGDESFQKLKTNKIILKGKSFDLMTSHPFDKKFQRFKSFFSYPYQRLLEQFALNVYDETGIDLIAFGAAVLSKPPRNNASVSLYNFTKKYEVELYTKLNDWAIEHGLSSYLPKESSLPHRQDISVLFPHEVTLDEIQSGQYNDQLIDFISSNEIHTLFINPIRNKMIMRRLELVKTLDWKLYHFLKENLELNIEDVVIDQFSQELFNFGISPGTASEKTMFSRTLNVPKKSFKAIKDKNVLVLVERKTSPIIKDLLYAQFKIHGANNILITSLTP